MTHLSDEKLLALSDGELPDGDVAKVRAHLDRCARCKARSAQFTRVSADLKKTHDRQTRRRQLAHMTLALAVGLGCTLWLGAHDSSAFARIPAVSIQTPALPVRYLTPGAVHATTAADLCSAAQEPEKSVPPSVRRVVLRNYGVRDLPDGDYELDYLITPELGGAADPQNLWPERYTSPTWNASAKDELEELLRRLVCNGSVPLPQAQRDMAVNWIAAYKRYFHTNRPGGLPGGLRTPLPQLE